MRSLPAAGLLTVGLIEEAVKAIVPPRDPLGCPPPHPRDWSGLGNRLRDRVCRLGNHGLRLHHASWQRAETLWPWMPRCCCAACYRLPGMLPDGADRVGPLAHARDIPRPRAPWLTVTASYAVAVILHTAWDASTAPLLHVVIAAASVAILAVLIRASHRRARVSAGNPTRGLPSHGGVLLREDPGSWT